MSKERVTITGGRNRGRSYAVGSEALRRELRNAQRRRRPRRAKRGGWLAAGVALFVLWVASRERRAA